MHHHHHQQQQQQQQKKKLGLCELLHLTVMIITTIEKI